MSEDRTGPDAFASPSGAAAGQNPRVINSSDILHGDREIIIQHGEERYRLRVTKAGKLILNK